VSHAISASLSRPASGVLQLVGASDLARETAPAGGAGARIRFCDRWLALTSRGWRPMRRGSSARRRSADMIGGVIAILCAGASDIELRCRRASRSVFPSM
jgi:hypothetical protein